MSPRLFIFFRHVLDFDVQHILRIQCLHEIDHVRVVKLRIVCLDYEKETIACREREVWCIENRMIRLRQLVQDEHA